MPTSQAVKPRIAIYGIGQYGGYIARFAHARGWPIVAAYNRAGDKVGKDLGQLVGLEKDLGVPVEDCELADYSQLDADVGVVTLTNQLSENLPAYQRLMGAGLNVLCHGSQAYMPAANDPTLAAEIDALAKANKVTFSGSGIWDMSRIWAGILAVGPCTQLNKLFHSSISDAAGQLLTAEQAAIIGVGFTVDAFHENNLHKSPIAGSYISIPQQVLTALGYTLKDSETIIEPITFDQPVASELMQRTLQAGEVVGSRVVCTVTTEQGVEARAEIELRLFREGEVEHMYWEVDGVPGTNIRVERKNSAAATAGCLFNRIPDVMAAEPGIKLISEMGPLRPQLINPQ